MNEREIFDAALEFDDREVQVRFVTEHCGGDSERYQRLLELLDAQRRLGTFLQTPPRELAATIEPPISEKPGTQIGPYKLLQEIGEGGMGVVYMAEQTSPVKRRVALKIIRPGMDSRQVIARFEAERQALAMMDHPNIAKVLDAASNRQRASLLRHGAGARGPHNAVLRRAPSDTSRTVDAIPIVSAMAVQHAHQKGVIHRDLKPSNVLVAHYDSQPVVKVIDFGVAKATGQTVDREDLVHPIWSGRRDARVHESGTGTV